ncbi:DUF177 domain-containing protein [Chloroflexota bacterium]
MQINVSQQLRASIGTMRNYELDENVDIVGNGGSRVQGEVRLIKTNDGILAKAILQIEVDLTCSRCLNLFSYPLTLSFEEEYFPTLDIASGMPLSLPDEPSSFTVDEHNILDLTEAVRQYGILAIPMKPLCNEDCTGLDLGSGQQ